MSVKKRVLILFCLVFAGEMIFSLPFHIARFFRPTFLAAFELSNAELGDVFAVYGVCAMLAYFPGGIVADRFAPRNLIACSLLATAMGGLYLAQFPKGIGLTVLFGYWGVTTIFLFWAAMIKATREVGGDKLQGRAFGVLDGGRGLVAAAVASIATILLSKLLPDASSELSVVDKQAAMQQVIYFYAAGTGAAALMAWLFIPITHPASSDPQSTNQGSLRGTNFLWIAFIVVCAYCGYKGVDNYGLYAVSVLGMTDLEAAKFTSTLAYMRPIAAVLAGVLADKFLSSRMVLIGFTLMAAAYLILSLFSPAQVGSSLLIINLIISVAGVYGVRAIYFALMHEDKIPHRSTGTAVGLISVIGFTPDIFFAPIAGRILDGAPGLEGQQQYFLLLACISAIGLIAAIIFLRRTIIKR